MIRCGLHCVQLCFDMIAISYYLKYCKADERWGWMRSCADGFIGLLNNPTLLLLCYTTATSL